MKRIQTIIYLLIFTLLLVSCQTTKPDDPSTPDVKTPSSTAVITDYFPVQSNTFYEYESAPTSIGDQQLYVTYVKDTRIQRRLSTERFPATEVLELKDGELRLIYGDPQFYYYEDITTVTPSVDILILKEPLQTGQKWQQDENTECEITSMDAPVETPLGSFTAMEVTSTLKNGSSQKEYYVKGIGLVQTVYIQESVTITTTLTKKTESASLDIPITVYYPDTDGGFATEDKTLTFHTNSDLGQLFDALFKTASQDGKPPLLSEDTAIIGLEVDRVNATVYLDLSEPFVKGFNGKSANEEQAALQAIANTIGQFLDEIDKLTFLVEGKPYSSDNIQEGTVMVEKAPELEVSE